MTQHDPEAWLDLARQALAPREADQARVLSALEQRLALPANEAGSELGRVHRQELNSVPAASPSIGMGMPSALLRWALGAIVPLAGVAAVSVFLSTRNATPRAPVLKPAPNVAAAIAPELDLSIAQVKEISAPRPAEPAVPAPKEKKPQRKKCRTAQGSERPCATTKTSESAIASAPQPTAAPSESSLSQELAALREAQRALREGRPVDALAVLTDFERAAAGRGAMQEERDAAATMARCALQPRSETKPLYDDFMARYPKSAYAARLARTCLPKPAR
jgi:hypothetical protein